MRQALRISAVAGVLIASTTAAGIWWAASAARQVPEFYARATSQLPRDPQALAAASRQMEEEVEQLQKQVGKLGDWSAVFSSEQVNAWLATELPGSFPHVLPKGVQEPRVAIEDGKIQVAARYASRRFDSVISFELRARLTDQPNVLALEVNELRAGAIPLPLSRFRSKIAQAASRGNVTVEWSEEDGNPIALVTVPEDHDGYITRPVVIEDLQILDGFVVLTGHSGPKAHRVFQPSGPVFRTASVAQPSTRNL